MLQRVPVCSSQGAGDPVRPGFESLKPRTNIGRFSIIGQEINGLTTLAKVNNLPPEVILGGIEEVNAVGCITRINLRGLNLTSLIGIDKLKSLVNGNFSGNSIKDISSLKDLKELKSLDLSRNRISDLGPLANHEKIECLLIESNGLVSIDKINNYKNLQVASFARNKIGDFSPISGNLNLNWLDISNNWGTSLEFILPLKKLAHFIASGNKFSDYSPILGSDSFKKVVLGRGVFLSDLAKVRSMADLKDLFHKKNKDKKDVVEHLKKSGCDVTFI